jgi:uncharacterized delta-60 repeat protein
MCAAAVVLGSPGTAVASPPGRLDRSFGDAGRAQAAFGGKRAEAQAVAMQGHEVVAAGVVGDESDEDLAVVRLTADGALDRTFGGGDGRFVRDVFGGADIANAIAVLPDDRILVAGQAYDPVSSSGRFVVLRLTPDGLLDRTFGGGDGVVLTRFGPGGAFGLSMTLVSDGRFVVCGNVVDQPSAFGMARYRPDGRLDRTFGAGGLATVDFAGQVEAICSAVVRAGAKVVAVGTVYDGSDYAMAVARVGAGGSPDPSFSGDGRAMFTPATGENHANGVVALPDRGVVLAGSVTNGVDPPDIALLRLDETGTPAAAFGGGDGVVIDDLGSADQAWDLVRQRDGRLIVVGFRNPDMFVARYKPLGGRDASFANDGVQASAWPAGPSTASAAAIDGARVVVAGAVMKSSVSRFAVERLFR